MKTINVLVRDKIASAVGDIVYICGNSDYIISFDFDEEWAVYDIKTARFVHNGTYTDVVFTGNQCDMPVIHKAYGIYVGVYAGDLRTTTPAHIPSAASILSADGTPAAPPDDVYAQLTELCNEAVSAATSVRNDADAGKFDGAPGKTPVPGLDYFTPEDKQAIAAEAAQKVGFPQPTVSDNGKYLGCENGAAKWMPVEASGGGSGNSDPPLLVDYTVPEGSTAKILEFSESNSGIEFNLANRCYFVVDATFPDTTKKILGISSNGNGQGTGPFSPPNVDNVTVQEIHIFGKYTKDFENRYTAWTQYRPNANFGYNASDKTQFGVSSLALLIEHKKCTSIKNLKFHVLGSGDTIYWGAGTRIRIWGD